MIYKKESMTEKRLSNAHNNVITVDHRQVACNGGGDSAGHPQVYLDLSTSSKISCPYCGRTYLLNASAKHAASH